MFMTSYLSLPQHFKVDILLDLSLSEFQYLRIHQEHQLHFFYACSIMRLYFTSLNNGNLSSTKRIRSLKGQNIEIITLLSFNSPELISDWRDGSLNIQMRTLSKMECAHATTKDDVDSQRQVNCNEYEYCHLANFLLSYN